MENEEVVESIPTETMESDEDFFSEVDSEVIAEETNGEEDTNSEKEETNEAEVPSEASEDNSKTEREVDFKPLLDALKGKIKYNKEEVNVESIEDLIENYQKGLNYDKKLQELENLQNSRLERYAKEKADALGISVDEYMNQVEAYEKQQERQREADELEDLINAGTPESIAKELIASRQQRKQIQQELNDIKAEREADFLKEFPEVNPESIPKEVFEDAESSSLKEAYMKWKLKELEKEISISKTNEKNKKSSVGSTTDTGTTNEKHEKDLFLEGFDE